MMLFLFCFPAFLILDKFLKKISVKPFTFCPVHMASTFSFLVLAGHSF